MQEKKLNALSILKIDYNKQGFKIIVDNFNKIHHGDIKITNNKTNKFRFFKFVSETDSEKIFKSDDNLILKVEKNFEQYDS